MDNSTDFRQFALEYRATFAKMMTYSPSQVGAGIYAEKLAELADAHPDWVEQIEGEE